MKYAIEFDIPDNETTRKSIKTDRVQWRFLGYGGYCMAQPVIHAHWHFYGTEYVHQEDIMCSNCKKNFTIDAYHYCDIGFTKDDLHYCPNCGAKMDEEVE